MNLDFDAIFRAYPEAVTIRDLAGAFDVTGTNSIKAVKDTNPKP